MSLWARRLSNHLDSLTATLSLRGTQAPIPVANFRLMLNRLKEANVDPHESIDTLFSIIKPISTSAVQELLRQHPTIRDNLVDYGNQVPSLYMSTPTGYSHLSLRVFAESLLKTAIVTGGGDTANLLVEYLSLGEARRLPCAEVTILSGLTVDTRIEIFPGLDILPYEHAVAQGLSINVKERDLVEGFRNIQITRQVCLVRSATFGPGVIPPHAVDTNEVWVSSIEFDCTDSNDISGILILLPLAAKTGIEVLGTSFCVPEFRGLNPHFRPSRFLGPGPHNQRRSKSELTPDSLAELRTMFVQYEALRDSHRPRLGLAARRLGSALSRTEGPFHTEDSILDVSIALEIMYALSGGGEIQNKLATRLAHFLADDPAKRYCFFERVRSLYSARSDIAHGRKTRHDIKQILDSALELALTTFRRLLARQELPTEDQWSKISVGHA